MTTVDKGAMELTNIAPRVWGMVSRYHWQEKSDEEIAALLELTIDQVKYMRDAIREVLFWTPKQSFYEDERW